MDPSRADAPDSLANQSSDRPSDHSSGHPPDPSPTIPPKRIFICLDGTTNDAIRDSNQMITNVARFARCLKPYNNGMLQIKYYHEGIGTSDGKKQSMDSATGASIHGDIQDAYHFLCLNYEPEDEIHLVGFSRGAFAARTLACFVNDFGILRATRLVALTMVYDWWKDSNKKQLNECAGRWADEGHLLINVPIKTCAVWDTVRSLFTDSNTGFPCWEQSKTLEFVEDQIPNRLNYAFQALALHETRKHFKPVLWNSDSNECTVIRETWFAGDHCDIGGGHEDCGLATIALLWMIAQFKEFTDVAFHEEMVLEYMTPMYFVSGDNTEYFLLTAFYTSGVVHGKLSWKETLRFIDSSLEAREHFLKAYKLDESDSPWPLNRGRVAGGIQRDPKAVASDRKTDPDHDSAEDIKALHGKSALTTIHRTVGLLETKMEESSPLLEGWNMYYHQNRHHTQLGEELKVIKWVKDGNMSEGIWQDRATGFENDMYEDWIRRENELWEKDRPGRFTAFLHRYRKDPMFKQGYIDSSNAAGLYVQTEPQGEDPEAKPLSDPDEKHVSDTHYETASNVSPKEEQSSQWATRQKYIHRRRQPRYTYNRSPSPDVYTPQKREYSKGSRPRYARPVRPRIEGERSLVHHPKSHEHSELSRIVDTHLQVYGEMQGEQEGTTDRPPNSDSADAYENNGDQRLGDDNDVTAEPAPGVAGPSDYHRYRSRRYPLP